MTISPKATLIVASTLGKNFSLPFDKVPSWYGISEETASRGMRELKSKGLMSSTSKMKHTPLEESITTREYRYSLVAPFGRRSTHATATPTLATVTPLNLAAGS